MITPSASRATPRWLRVLPWLCLAVATLLSGGCKLVELKLPGEPLSRRDHELRTRTREFAVEFATTVETAADGVSAATTDGRVKTAATRWKIGAISAARRAALRPSPTLAVVDSWALCVQMQDFLQRGAGTNLFGNDQMRAVTNAQALERRIAAIANDTLGRSRAGELRQFITSYAAAYPLNDLGFEREPLAGRWEESNGEPDVAPTGTPADALADLSGRVQILGEQLPAELRWRISLQAGELEKSLTEMLVTSQRLEGGLTRIADVATGSPAVLSNAVMELRAGLVPVFGGLEKQWASTITSLQQERAALAGDIAREREAVLKAVDQQRAAVMKDVERMAGDVTDRSLNHLRGMVKDVLFYAVLLAIIVLGLPFAFGFLLGRATRRARADVGAVIAD